MKKLNPLLNGVTEELSSNTQNIFGSRLRKIILYGSYARGDYNVYSDLDIMVLADYEESEEKILESSLFKVSSQASLNHDITVCMMLNNENLFMSRLRVSPFYRNVLSEGLEIYATP